MQAPTPVCRASRFLRVFVITVTASVAVMGISFLVTLSVARDRNEDRRPPAHVIEQGDLLRSLCNDLLRLTEDFVGGVPRSALPPPTSVRQWIERSFLPRLNVYRVRVNKEQSGGPATRDAVAALYSAAEQISNTLKRPAELEGRRAALQAVLEAAGKAEATLRDQGSHRFLHAPPHVPRFREDS